MATIPDVVDGVRTRMGTAAVGLVLTAAVTGVVVTAASTALTPGSPAKGSTLQLLGPAPSVTASVPQPAETSHVTAPAQRASAATPAVDAHCAGFLFGYDLVHSRIEEIGVMPPAVSSPDLAACPSRMIVPLATSEQAWCVGAASAVALLWPALDALTMAREVAATVDNSCMPAEWWQLDPTMYGIGGLSDHPAWSPSDQAVPSPL